MLIFQEDAEILFPARVIPDLRDERGEVFRALVDRVAAHDSEGNPEVLGFSLMMIRLASCLTCSADSYRSMNGCPTCAIKTIRSFRGSDEELVTLWETACRDVVAWFAEEARQRAEQTKQQPASV